METEYRFNSKRLTDELKAIAKKEKGDRYKNMSIDSGVSQSAIYGFVKKGRSPSLVIFLKLCTYLKKNPINYIETIKPNT